jgi:hypothetical protein
MHAGPVRSGGEDAMAAVGVPDATVTGATAGLAAHRLPEHWRLMGRERTFDWVGADGAGTP